MKVKSSMARAFCGALPILALSFFIGLAAPAFSQTQDPYLVSATFYISVDDWADLWLNDVPIVDSQPRTPANADTKIITAKPNSLCYFSRENILAIEITKTTLKNKFASDPSVGFGYFLILKLSDGREVVLSSNESDQHRALYLADQADSEPAEWHNKFFNDASWTSAFPTLFRLPQCAQVKDPRSGEKAIFLSARSMEPKALMPGERHLFRRYFSLPISQNPLCLSPTPLPQNRPSLISVPKPNRKVLPLGTPEPRQLVLVPPTPLPQPAYRPPEGPRHEEMPHPHLARPAFTPTVTRPWTFTPTFTRPFTSTATSTYSFTSTPTPPFTPTVYFTWYPTASFTPWPRVYSQPTPFFAIPTPFPVEPTPIPTVGKKTKRTHRLTSAYLAAPSSPATVVSFQPILLTPTPTVDWLYRPPSSTPTPLPILPLWATPTPSPALTNSQAQTLEVPMPPANLYVNFADGPGIYQLAIYDSQGQLIRSIYQKRAINESDDWAVWDGKNESGQDALPGYYRVLFTLNGVQLKDVIIHLVAGNP